MTLRAFGMSSEREKSGKTHTTLNERRVRFFVDSGITVNVILQKSILNVNVCTIDEKTTSVKRY